MMKVKQDVRMSKCNQCGSDLILIKEIIEEKDLPSPVTALFYRCTDKSCQAEIDQKAAAQVKRVKEHEKAQANRNKNRLKRKR